MFFNFDFLGFKFVFLDLYFQEKEMCEMRKTIDVLKAQMQFHEDAQVRNCTFSYYKRK